MTSDHHSDDVRDQAAVRGAKRSRTTMLLVAAAAFVVGVVVGAVSQFGPKQDSADAFSVTGSVTWTGVRGSCAREPNTMVVVSNESGTAIGIGYLDEPTQDGNFCVHRFTVPNVPAGRATYGVAVADRERMLYSEQLVRQPLRLEYSHQPRR